MRPAHNDGSLVSGFHSARTEAEKAFGMPNEKVAAGIQTVVELVDQARRRGEAKSRPLLTRINNGQAKRLIPPRVIQIKMQSARNQRFYLGDCKRN